MRERAKSHASTIRRPPGAALLALLLGAGSVLAVVPSNAGPSSPRVRAIRAAEAEGETTVVIASTGKPTFTTWKLERPARVVVEVSGARLGDVDVPFDAGTFAVGSVSASTVEDDSGPRTRVVLTLRHAADYKVEAREHDIVVRILPHVRPTPAAPAEGARLAEERARTEAATRKLAEERAKAEEAHRAARAERERAEQALRDATAAKAQAEARAKGTSRVEEELKKAQREAEEARERARAAERRAEAARAREEARGQAEREATAQVEARRRALEEKWSSLEEQRRRLAEVERVVAEREAKVQAAAAALAARQKEAAEAEARRAALAKAADASEEDRRRAAREAAEAERQRKEALAEAERTRGALADAESARKREESRKRDIERERLEEERRLRSAVAARTAEEERLAQARTERERLQTERERLQAERDALSAEVSKLRAHTVAASPAPRAAAVQAAPATVAAASPASRAAAVQAAPAAVEPAGRPRSITLRVPARIHRVDFVDEPTRSSVIIDLDEPSAFAVERSGRRLTLRLLHAELPRGLERSLDASEYLGPVRVISTYRDPEARGAVRVDVDLAEDVPNRVRQDGSRLYWDFQKTPPQKINMGSLERPLAPHTLFLPPRKVAGFRAVSLAAVQAQVGGSVVGAPGGSFRPATATTRKRYTGRRVDLDFKSADIHNILRLLADVGQVNIVTSDDVKGEVTIKMRDVPWDQALDVVLRGKQLGSVREGNLIRVAPLAVLEKELEQEIARQKQLTDVLPTETRLIGVSYAEARNLEARAKDLLSPRGKISVDERTNNLIVSDVAKNLALIEELVRNLDTQTSQVVIEARIVEARSTFVRQFGIQWGGTGFADVDHGNPTGLVFPYNIGIGGGATDSQAPVEGLVAQPRSGYGASNPNFAVNLPVAAGTGAGGALGLTLGSVAGAFNLNLRLSALESSGQVRILSSPRVTTMDNIEASIEQGVAIPISVVSAQGVQTVFVDAKLNLTVKPHVTNEGTVMLQINVTRNEPDFVNTGARGDPTILKKEARTAMLVRDGDTAVIGGIYTRNSGLNYAKVPFFADIPVLGVLFRNRRENDDRTEFLVFITPRIANRARALGQ